MNCELVNRLKKDVSFGKEKFPIPCIGDEMLALENLPRIKYITKNFSQDIDIDSQLNDNYETEECNCYPTCSDQECFCLRLQSSIKIHFSITPRISLF